MSNTTEADQIEQLTTSFYQAKIAFEIPGHYKSGNGVYGPSYDDRLIDALMDLFEDSSFETENLCSPALLIVSIQDVPTEKWISNSMKRIHSELKKFYKNK